MCVAERERGGERSRLEFEDDLNLIFKVTGVLRKWIVWILFLEVHVLGIKTKLAHIYCWDMIKN